MQINQICALAVCELVQKSDSVCSALPSLSLSPVPRHHVRLAFIHDFNEMGFKMMNLSKSFRTGEIFRWRTLTEGNTDTDID